ncbi:MAG: hypothetical protein CYPHOPRED_004099 [Cyphobasidiales sp. Tagirdzhanova-0007]|nr:MAG: hypothetical protein CYPHOPRED_004099 [Cyphobasidiales sp. Tagirdzhanova-0007]
MAIIHIVHFGYTSDATKEQKRLVASAFLALKDTCLKDGTKRPYIVNIAGGKNNSPEGQAHGLEQSFIVTFEDAQDRDYYVFEDPVHQEFKALVGSSGLEQSRVLDFEDGQF